jgi:predicted MFS family arabinose efflux permease
MRDGTPGVRGSIGVVQPFMPAAARPVSERKIILLLAAISFVNILDFMMVMPLGPDFARALGIPTSNLGIIGGSYTAAAAVAGLVGALFLDRFDRRSALAVAMLGLVLSTAAGGLAVGFHSLVAARVLAGLFGGPATSLGLSILADVVPVERRGRAMGTLMGAFAAASVLGVTAGLELARIGGWRTPFFAVAGLGVVLIAAAIAVMPPMRGHLDRAQVAPPRGLGAFLRDPVVLLSYAGTVAVFAGGFAVIPNLSAYLQENLGYPRARLGLLYFVGGLVSFFATRIGGSVVDRSGPVVVTAAGTTLLVLDLFAGFVVPRPLAPILLIFVLFMLANATRSVALHTLASRIPYPAERARFMSGQSAVQHMAAATGAVISALLLSERPGGGLDGMASVALFAAVLASAVPFIIRSVARRVQHRPALAASAA